MATAGWADPKIYLGFAYLVCYLKFAIVNVMAYLSSFCGTGKPELSQQKNGMSQFDLFEMFDFFKNHTAT